MNEEIKVLYLKALAKKYFNDLKERGRLELPYLGKLPISLYNEKPDMVIDYKFIHLEIDYYEHNIPIVRGRMPGDEKWTNLWVEL